MKLAACLGVVGLLAAQTVSAQSCGSCTGCLWTYSGGSQCFTTTVKEACDAYGAGYTWCTGGSSTTKPVSTTAPITTTKPASTTVPVTTTKPAITTVPPTNGGFTWALDTSVARTLTKVASDPDDKEASMNGSGSIAIATNGIVTMKGSPRYYITAPSGTFLNVEVIAYGRLPAKKTFSDIAGMTMVTRSNHGDFDEHPCDALGYYSRIYFNTGEFAFQKEFYHENGGLTIYTASRRKAYFSGGFPVNKWIGMKYVLKTNPDGKSVHLQLFVDENESGTWNLVFETDDNGGWKATSTVPATCGYTADKIILAGGRNSYFRTDDVDSFQWKKMQIRTL